MADEANTQPVATPEAPDAKPEAPTPDTPEVKAAAPAPEAKADTTEPKAPEAKADAPAPVEYKFNTPEGIAADPELTEQFTALAKEMNLPADKAQQVYDLGSKLAQKVAATHLENVAKTQAEWLEMSKADKEFGGDKLEESKAIAKRAVQVYPEIAEFLAESKLGDHPEVFRWMYRVGKTLGEDRIIHGNPPSNDSVLNRLYPSMAPKH